MIEPQPKRHSPLIWLVFLVIVIDLIGFGLVIPLLPFMAPALGGDSSDIAFIMITYAIGAALIAPLWGRFSDRAGRRQALVLALVCSCAAYVVTALADTVIASHGDLDTLIHNAGALSAQRTENADGIESTVASQVLGPFLLTARLLPTLRSNGPARVLTMSSGGMYSTGLTVNRLQMSGLGSADPYRGAEQYARAKRAQVTLTEIWAEKFADSGVRFHSLHPGWADTPGVEKALPTFRKIVGPLLRSPAEGADTLVWLTADDTVVVENGLFWHDRAPRAIHRLPQTRRSDTPERRADLWDWCVAQTGVDPEA